MIRRCPWEGKSYNTENKGWCAHCLLILSGFLSRITNVEERRPDQEDSGLNQRLSTGSSPPAKYQIILTTCCLLLLASLEPGYQWLRPSSRLLRVTAGEWEHWCFSGVCFSNPGVIGQRELTPPLRKGLAYCSLTASCQSNAGIHHVPFVSGTLSFSNSYSALTWQALSPVCERDSWDVRTSESANTFKNICCEIWTAIMLCPLENLAKWMESLLPGLRQWHDPQERQKHVNMFTPMMSVSKLQWLPMPVNTPHFFHEKLSLLLLSNSRLEFLSLLSRIDPTSQNNQSKVCKT